MKFWALAILITILAIAGVATAQTTGPQLGDLELSADGPIDPRARTVYANATVTWDCADASRFAGVGSSIYWQVALEQFQRDMYINSGAYGQGNIEVCPTGQLQREFLISVVLGFRADLDPQEMTIGLNYTIGAQASGSREETWYRTREVDATIAKYVSLNFKSEPHVRSATGRFAIIEIGLDYQGNGPANILWNTYAPSEKPCVQRDRHGGVEPAQLYYEPGQTSSWVELAIKAPAGIDPVGLMATVESEAETDIIDNSSICKQLDDVFSEDHEPAVGGLTIVVPAIIVFVIVAGAGFLLRRYGRDGRL